VVARSGYLTARLSQHPDDWFRIRVQGCGEFGINRPLGRP
jgi:hypothetical protein